MVEYVHPEERERAKAFWDRCRQGLTVEEYRIVRPDGSLRWIRRRGFPIPDEQGKVEFRAGISEDITQEKRLQQERDRLLDSERTARQLAERGSRVKDEFLATLSHELRSPLNAILGWVQILRMKPPAPEMLNKAIEAIERNSQAQARLIEDLLDMSSIVSGKFRLEVQTIDLAMLIRTSVESVLPAAEAKGIRLQQVLNPLVGPIKGDPNRVRQVIWNLLSNAVKFTSRGGTIQVHLEQVNSHCEISVSDTGRGIRPEFLPFVFERFRQEDSTTTRMEGGLGLGLAIVKQLVEHHGGTVAVMSAGEGRGATFVVRLPISIARNESAEEAVPVLSPIGLDLSLEGMRILVVDDDADACVVLRRILEEQKANVDTLSSAVGALEKIRMDPPDVLVSDIGMPELDGYQFIAEVRRLEGPARAIPAIAVTAFARPQDRVRALQAGYNMHLAKPINAIELVTVIARLKSGG
jgi:signal transduction histidine kinase/ActR/RegA family two-component response regulator